jgi:hypothetical protein
MKQLLPGKRNKYYIFVCVCVCELVRRRVCECMRVYVGVGALARACICARAALLIHHVTPPYCHLRPCWLH